MLALASNSTAYGSSNARAFLSPSGVVVLCFDPQTAWIADRLVGLLESVFGVRPLSFYFPPNSPCLGPDGLLLIAGSASVLSEVRQRVSGDPEVSRALIPEQRWPLKTPLTTDDWPYLYLRHRSFPPYHVLIGLSGLAIGLAPRRRLFQTGEPVNGMMLLLGAGFMLLEVTGVSRAALLYGTIWAVNAYAVAARYPAAGLRLPFLGLALSLLALGLVPPCGSLRFPPCPGSCSGAGSCPFPPSSWA